MKQFDKWPDMTVFMTDAVTVKNGRLYHWGSKEMVKKLLRLPLKLHRYSDKESIKKGVLKLGNPVMCPSCAYRKNYLPDPFPFRASFCSGLGLHDRSSQLAGKMYLCGEASSVLPGT